jgi:hypothetical protein
VRCSAFGFFAALGTWSLTSTTSSAGASLSPAWRDELKVTPRITIA